MRTQEWARTAAIVFQDRAAPGGLRWLRRGFRHCFCVVGAGRRWTVCDPLKGGVLLETVDGLALDDLLTSFRELGAVTLVGPLRPAPLPARFRLAPFTCVELVKRLTGVDAPHVLTPFQLFRHLDRPGSGFALSVS